MKSIMVIIITSVAVLCATSCDESSPSGPPRFSPEWRNLASDEFSYRAFFGTSASNLYAGRTDGGIDQYDGTSWISIVGALRQRVRDIWVSEGGRIYVCYPDGIFRQIEDEWEKLNLGDLMGPQAIWGVGEELLLIASGTGLFEMNLQDGEVTQIASEPYADIWGAVADAVYAVQYNTGGAMRFDGEKWTNIPADGIGGLRFICGGSRDEFYVLTQAMLYHYDGYTWNKWGMPGLVTTGWVLGSDVYVATNERVWHLEDTEWRPVYTGTSVSMWTAWGGDERIYLAGRMGKVVSFNGSEWATLREVSLSGGRTVVGIDDANVYVGFHQGVFNYDGGGFRELPATNEPLQIYDLWGTAPDNLIAVGFSQRVERYDGTSWRALAFDIPNVHWLRAISGTDDGTAYAVGPYDSVVKIDGDIVTLVYQDRNGGSGRGFEDVWVASPTELFVAGLGAIVHYKDGNWTTDRIGSNLMTTVWGTSPTDVYAGSENIGGVFHYDGMSWTEIELSWYLKNHQFGLVTGTSFSNVFVVGNRGALAHFDGGSWLVSAAVWATNLSSIWASPNSTLYAVGYEDIIVVEP